MANVLLVSYPGEPVNPTTFLPDNGLASLAATLQRGGHGAHILDYGTIDLLRQSYPEGIKSTLLEMFQNKQTNSSVPGIDDKIIEIDKTITAHREALIESIGKEIASVISAKSIDLVGFKSWGGDAYPALLRLTDIVKDHFPQMPIAVGGPQVTTFGNIMAEHKSFDVLCYDEGELTIEKLAQYVDGKRNIHRIPSIKYRKNGAMITNPHEVVMNLDDLAFPTYDATTYPAMGGNQKFNMIVIDESRRCMYKCPFCIESSKVKSKWRPKSASRIVQEVKKARDLYGSRLIRFGGQMTPGYLLEEVSRQLLEEKVDVQFTSFSHISTMKDADFEMMKGAGLYALFFGVESGNQGMLSTTLGKRTKVEDIASVLRRASDAGIYTVASIIYPSPGDNEQSLRDTVELLTKAHVQSAPVQFAGVYPGTTWERKADEYGFTLDTRTYARSIMNYKIKNLFPPQFWDPMPVQISGKNFHEYISETGKMIYALESNGILTDVTDEQALLAHSVGMTPRDFRTANQRIFYTGAWREMQDQIQKVNQ
jgi:radical SAM superfamily enzyme YgiQ (UPF0313 family)